MTSKFKCPFCGEELDEDTLGDFRCINPECKGSICFSGSKLLWQAFIQTKEELKDCQHNYSVKTEQHERGYAYATKTIKDLKSKLEIARKALEEIDTSRYIPQQTLISLGKRSKTTRFNAKFRVWNKKSGAYDSQTTFILFDDGTLGEFDYGSIHNQDWYVVEQCTGLKDKNGNLIYEGDIVLGASGFKYCIIWSEMEVGWALQNLESKVCIAMNAFTADEIEIIGNVHQTKE